MTVSPIASLPHPLVSGVGAVEQVLDGMPVGGWDGLEPRLVRELTERLMRITSRVQAHQAAAARVLDESGLAKQLGATSTGALLAGAFGGDRADGDRAVRLGQALEAASLTQEALAGGRVSAGQAAVIAGAVADVPEAHRDTCEQTLIAEADRLRMPDLRRRAARISDQYLPEPEVDRVENDSLVERERRAWAKAEFQMFDNRDGTHSGRFTLPDAQADMLNTAVQAIAAPRRDHLQASGSLDGAEFSHRLGVGLAELCNHLPTDKLPSGGLSATLLVRFDHETLLNGVKAATLSTGTRISAGQVRRLACNAGLIPQVFNGKSLPLDHGEEKRYFTLHQRRALEHRDQGCTFPGCDRPPGWCEAHHAKEKFSVGKTTRLDEGVLICPHHHRVVHDQHWHTRFNPHDGIPEYRRDPSEPWQRNQRC